MSHLIEEHRAALLGLAYRLLGSVSDAEDMVQETFLRTRYTAWANIDNPRAYLMRTTTHLCLDHLKSARVRREVYPGTWLPEPVIGETYGVVAKTEQTLDLSFALLLTLERLTPLERAAFVLHDIFDTGYAELAGILARSEATCRQLVARARVNIAELKVRFTPSPEQVARVFGAFAQATQCGDPSILEAVLCEDAVLYSDGGGKVKAALLPIYGKDRVARFFVGVANKWFVQSEVTAQPTIVNGAPGVILRYSNGAAPTVLCFEFAPTGDVTSIYSLRNPEKLRHVT